MALGRIKRNRRKAERAGQRESGSTWKDIRPARHHRKIKVGVEVTREWTGRYHAKACIGGDRYAKKRHAHCGFTKSGRTPQSAVAKALKSLSSTVARRR